MMLGGGEGWGGGGLEWKHDGVCVQHRNVSPPTQSAILNLYKFLIARASMSVKRLDKM